MRIPLMAIRQGEGHVKEFVHASSHPQDQPHRPAPHLRPGHQRADRRPGRAGPLRGARRGGPADGGRRAGQAQDPAGRDRSVGAVYADRGGQITPERRLWANQFVVLRSGSQSALGQVRASVAAGEPVELTLVHDAPETFGVRARSKEQHFALHLLRDPGIPLVSLAGNAGTGKTYLAVAAGLDATMERSEYDRVLVFRPVVPVGRQDLGFLPGDVDEKISPWMKAIHDTMAQLFRGSHDAGTVQLEPLTFIRGRTFVRTFAILDEAQNVEYGVLRSLASRLGEGSKLVLCHDTTQVDHPYVDPESGVAALIERLKGEPLFGHVNLLKGERSPVAELVARRL